MPTAVLMGMGLTPHLAQADEQPSGSVQPGPCVTRSDTPTPAATHGAAHAGKGGGAPGAPGKDGGRRPARRPRRRGRPRPGGGAAGRDGRSGSGGKTHGHAPRTAAPSVTVGRRSPARPRGDRGEPAGPAGLGGPSTDCSAPGRSADRHPRPPAPSRPPPRGEDPPARRRGAVRPRTTDGDTVTGPRGRDTAKAVGDTGGKAAGTPRRRCRGRRQGGKADKRRRHAAGHQGEGPVPVRPTTPRRSPTPRRRGRASRCCRTTRGPRRATG